MSLEYLESLFSEAQKIINTHHLDSSKFFAKCDFEIGFTQETDDALGFCKGTFQNYIIGLHELMAEKTNDNFRTIIMTFVHELLHIIHVDWPEKKVADEEYRLANLAGYFDTLQRRYHDYLPRLRNLKNTIERSNIQRGIQSEKIPSGTLKISGKETEISKVIAKVLEVKDKEPEVEVKGKEPEVEVTGNLIWASYLIKKYDEALILADKFLQEHGDDGRTLYYKGRIFFDQKKYPEALECIDKALARIPNDPFPIYFKALILMQSVKLEEAENYFSEAFDKNQEEGEHDKVLARNITYYRAKVAKLLGKDEIALVYLSQLTSFYPETKNEIANSFTFRKYQDDPRFKELIKE